MKKIIVFARILVLSTSIASTFSACKKDKDEDIPYVYVNFTAQLSNPQYINLNAIGGWVYLNGEGSRGIIIYRKSNDEFKAYDRHCTYQPGDACGQVAVDGSGLLATDSCCGSQFVLTDGSVTKGPATVSLKQYHVSYDGAILKVYN